jgi:hypothetical protein
MEKVDVVAISVAVKQDDLYGEGKEEVINKVSELPDAMMRMLKKAYRYAPSKYR